MRALLALVLAASGFHGTVTRGPTRPVCTVGRACSGPAVGAVLLFERRGRVVRRVRVGRRGHYAVRLAPGIYVVRTGRGPAIGRGIRPRRVHVVRGAARRLDFSIDTGIR